MDQFFIKKIFHKIFKIFVVINQKKVGMGGNFCQNPRGDPKSHVDLTRNDRETTTTVL